MRKILLLVLCWLSVLIFTGCDNDGSASIATRLCDKIKECSLLGQFGYDNYDVCVAKQDYYTAKYLLCKDEFSYLRQCQISLNCEKFEEDDPETHCPVESKLINKCLEEYYDED